MNPKEWLKNLLRQTCLYFTICTAVYALITWIVNVDATRVMLDASRVMLFFLFSLLLAFAGGILHITKLNSALRRILHYLITLFEINVVASVEIDRKFLVVLCDLLAEVSGAGVNNEIFCAVLRFVDLDEVVAATQCA